MKRVNDYGCFDKEGKCFVLTQEPPRKWVNVHYNQVGDDEIYSEITNIGDGFTTVRDKDGNSCTLVDYDSKYLYIRDDATNDVFSPWGEPVATQLDSRECRFYAAKTEICGSYKGLNVKQRVFVPRTETAEVWTLTVDNTTNEDKELSIFGYAMFQLTGRDSNGNGIWKENCADVVSDLSGVYVENRRPDLPHDRYKGYLITTSDCYFNSNGYRDHFTRSDFSYSTPKILWGWNCDGRPGYGPDCAGIVQVKIKVPAGEQGRVDYILGQTGSIEEVAEIKARLTPEEIDRLSEEQCEIEEIKQGAFSVDTGNENIDSLINFFVKKQMTSYNINKSGFRDNLQNDCGVAMFDVKMAEENFLRALSSQYISGGVPHSFRPLNKLQYSDKPAWIFMTAPSLIKESGDISLLEKMVPYIDSDVKETVFDHMIKTMRYMSNDLGPNGLSDQHHADWNDGLEATEESGNRESVMVSMQFCYGMREFAELSKRYGREDIAQEANDLYETFKSRLNEVAWDGDWYVRTICEDGYKIGSDENFEGKIFLNPQSWSILSGVADEQRAEASMKSVDSMIETEIGYRICSPGFSKFDPRVGRMSEAIADHIENGGCYNHAAGFKGVADCIQGRAEEAWTTFKKVVPGGPFNPVEQSGNEPFSFTNSYSMNKYIYGKGGYAWKTGTAPWFTMLLVEWILGIRRDYDGLLIDPCMSKELDRVKVVRTYRGAVYNIEIDNTAGRCRGVTELYLDGELIEGNLITCMDKKQYSVKVVV